MALSADSDCVCLCNISIMGTDHSQNPSTITTMKSPKEKINCAVRVFCESRNGMDE